jgi:hypothetical protein
MINLIAVCALLVVAVGFAAVLGAAAYGIVKDARK